MLDYVVHEKRYLVTFHFIFLDSFLSLMNKYLIAMYLLLDYNY